jgi:hypothetical protein
MAKLTRHTDLENYQSFVLGKIMIILDGNVEVNTDEKIKQVRNTIRDYDDIIIARHFDFNGNERK